MPIFVWGAGGQWFAVLRFLVGYGTQVVAFYIIMFITSLGHGDRSERGFFIASQSVEDFHK